MNDAERLHIASRVQHVIEELQGVLDDLDSDVDRARACYQAAAGPFIEIGKALGAER